MKATPENTLLLATATLRLLGATPALTPETAQPRTAGGVAINLGNHAGPRLVDWKNDGVLDLLFSFFKILAPY